MAWSLSGVVGANRKEDDLHRVVVGKGRGNDLSGVEVVSECEEVNLFGVVVDDKLKEDDLLRVVTGK